MTLLLLVVAPAVCGNASTTAGSRVRSFFFLFSYSLFPSSVHPIYLYYYIIFFFFLSFFLFSLCSTSSIGRIDPYREKVLWRSISRRLGSGKKKKKKKKNKENEEKRREDTFCWLFHVANGRVVKRNETKFSHFCFVLFFLSLSQCHRAIYFTVLHEELESKSSVCNISGSFFLRRFYRQAPQTRSARAESRLFLFPRKKKKMENNKKKIHQLYGKDPTKTRQKKKTKRMLSSPLVFFYFVGQSHSEARHSRHTHVYREKREE